ncbi:hypothetical protein [Urbifossiella limnaea]|uniref:hypothetical protein n=1 Tax=Urbifossiella limnaea TaxID=2528023 RepID=UPI00192E5478|nr:hypothetical protein [Urbifossiella limnaea]
MQELEAECLAGAAGRAGGLDRLAAAWSADGLDGAAAEVQRRSRGLKAADGDGPGGPPPPALLGACRKPRPR